MIYSLGQKTPQLNKGAWIAESADVIGDVRLGKNSSVWFGSVVRGDINYIEIGENSNIQDRCVLHVGDDDPCVIGKNCIVGHSVTLHGCLLEENVLVGIGTIVLNKAHIGAGCIIAAGSLIPPGKVIPPRSLVMGSPGQVVREVIESDYESNIHYAQKYVRVKNLYMSQEFQKHLSE